jgi:CDP-4-dehydro-6-deoxyglucose reductase, E3
MRITVLGTSLPAPAAPEAGLPAASPSGPAAPGRTISGTSLPGRPESGATALGESGLGESGLGGSGLGESGLGQGPSEVSLECGPGETVLSALTRQGVRLPSACQAGVCRACLVRALHGDPGPAGSAGLEDALRADGYFLACQARPAADLTMSLAGGDIYTPARLLSVRPDGPALRVRVRPDRPLSFRAGQHVALRIPAARVGTPRAADGRRGDDRSGHGRDTDGRDTDSRAADGRRGDGRSGHGRDTDGRDTDGRPGGAELVRVYSFANRPVEAVRDGVEFYVRVYPGGAMSTWLASARPGAELSLGRPSGTCCYQPGEPGAPLLLAGTGTGVAPLAAAARDALAHGHHGPIVLLRGAADPSGLYPEERLPPDPVRVRTCVLSGGEDIVAAVVAEYTALAGAPRTGVTGVTQVYLCGGLGVVARMRRALFLAGQPLRRIHCDGFSPAVQGSS